jgi:predicted transcriptional regulator
LATERTPGTIILPILPQYATQIMEGSKNVEFRKKNIPLSVARVVVYATMPLGRVIGYFYVTDCTALSPSEAWERFGEVGGIQRDAFLEYYGESNVAHVLRVGERFPLNVHLSTLRELGIKVSQGFSYVDDAQFQALVEYDDQS